MSFLKPKFVLLLAACVLGPTLVISACGGTAFTGDDGSSGGGTSNNPGTGGTVGTGAGTGIACDGPEDCDDKKPDTVDRCNADGTCDAAPLCTGNLKYCGDGCAECCDDQDCDDGVSCTRNTCFASQCMYVPDDSSCEVTQYCSTKDGCRLKQACGLIEGEDTAVVCDDGSGCTSDICAGNFCQHDFCAQGDRCCEDKGCATCCNDSQCNLDNDPCTVGSCSAEGTCSEVPLCTGDQQCCPGPDGTATCGSCCSAEDCNDTIGCTDDACGGGRCSNTPNDKRCDNAGGYICDPSSTENGGCYKAPDCTNSGDCVPPSACQTNPRCEGGVCQFAGCPTGSKCCGDAGCAACCDASECADMVACTTDACGPNGCTHTPDDSRCPAGQVCDAQLDCVGCIKDAHCDDDLPCTDDTCFGNRCLHKSTCATGQYCDPTSKGCVGCLSDNDCKKGVGTLINTPGGCSVAKCVMGTCIDEPVVCSGKLICCAPYGCTLPGSCTVLETQ